MYINTTIATSVINNEWGRNHSSCNKNSRNHYNNWARDANIKYERAKGANKRRKRLKLRKYPAGKSCRGKIEEKRLQVTAVANKMQAHKCGRWVAFVFLCRGYERGFPPNIEKRRDRTKCAKSSGAFVLNEGIILMWVLSLNYISLCF